MLWLMIAVISGFVQGSFTLPMKSATRTWKWEHTWGMWSVWALLILPWLIALLTVPGLFDIYASVPRGNLLLVFLVGLGWGIGAITFGMGVHYVGIAIGFAVIMGLTTALGSLIPLFRQSAAVLTPTGLCIMAGVGLMMLGIAISAKAGMLKDKALASAATDKETPERKSFIKGLIICIVAGVCGSWMNIAFDFGKPIISRAIDSGVSSMYASNAVWSISLLGGFLVNLGYCLYLIAKHGTWSLFRAREARVNWLHTFGMGLMWMGSLAVYGICSVQLGSLGTAMGFAVFLGMAIVTGNFWGMLTGEWKGGGARPFSIMAAGVLVILAGMGVIGWGNSLAGG